MLHFKVSSRCCFFHFTEMRSSLSLKVERGENKLSKLLMPLTSSYRHKGSHWILWLLFSSFFFFKQTWTGVCFQILFSRSGQNQSVFYLKSDDTVKLELLGCNFKNILTILAYLCPMSPPAPMVTKWCRTRHVELGPLVFTQAWNGAQLQTVGCSCAMSPLPFHCLCNWYMVW